MNHFGTTVEDKDVSLTACFETTERCSWGTWLTWFLTVNTRQRPNYVPVIWTEAWQEAAPASLLALHVYVPLSERREFLMSRTARLFLKVISYLSELEISVPSLNQFTVIGCDPATRASIFTNLPSVSSMLSEGFLVKLGGILRSRNKKQVCR